MNNDTLLEELKRNLMNLNDKYCKEVNISFMFDKNGTHGQLYRASNNRLLGIITGKNDTNITYTHDFFTKNICQSRFFS